MKRYLGLIFTCWFLTACTAPSVELNPEAAGVHVRMDSDVHLKECEWKGEATGTEGHWYTYLFFDNDAMMWGAMYDIKNNAYNIGGNTVFLHSPHYFQTSITLMGTVYWCDYGETGVPAMTGRGDVVKLPRKIED